VPGYVAVNSVNIEQSTVAPLVHMPVFVSHYPRSVVRFIREERSLCFISRAVRSTVASPEGHSAHEAFQF
jgi:hypothetical protein